MTALFAHIRALIEKNGPISLARYMELALQHPEWGYYRKGDPLGPAGDFITAPEISQMFGELIGLCLAEAWKGIGQPEKFTLLELGPGRGTLMQDALRGTAKIHGFHAAMTLHLLESNETLRKMQMEKLAAYGPVFLDDTGELFNPLASPPRRRGSISETSGKNNLPEMDARLRGHDEERGLPTFIVANEFFDALPMRQFENSAEGWRERLVTMDGEEFEFILSKPDPAFLFLIPPELREAPVGTVHEVSLPALALTRRIARHVTAQGGAALIVDYGYATAPGKATLQAASSHRHADVLERPGEVDLTAHVDFVALRQMAQGQGAAVLGPLGQGEFLQALGIDMRAMQLKHNAAPEQAHAIDAALRRLTDPAEMGTLFKAMAIVSPKLGSLAGF